MTSALPRDRMARARIGFDKTSRTVDISGYKSSPLTEELVSSADVILVMEEHHRSYITSRVPEARDKTYLYKEFAKVTEGVNKDISDPIGKSKDFYKKVKDEIKNASAEIAIILKTRGNK